MSKSLPCIQKFWGDRTYYHAYHGSCSGPLPHAWPPRFSLVYAVQPQPVNNLLITLASRHNIIDLRNLLQIRQLACSHKHDYATLIENTNE